MTARPDSILDPSQITTPAFVIEEAFLRHNLGILRQVKEKTGCKMLQALKTWATWPLFGITREYLDGTEGSSLYEARLGYEHFNHEVHIFAPAYKDEEFDEILKYCSTIIFNSLAQWQKFKPRVRAYEKETEKKIECGLRINPEYVSDGEHGGMWSPCAPGSRLGVRLSELEAGLASDPSVLNGLSGLHFHIFWDKEFVDLQKAVSSFEDRFAKYFQGMQWINFGGGQKITDDGYDIEGLIALVNAFQKKYGLRVHLEPGAAIVKNAGFLVSRVLDVVERDDVPYKIAILDMSFNAHAPDFLLSRDLDMPVRGAKVVRGENLAAHENLYQLGGGTCVTGDKLDHLHAFARPLAAGDTVVMEDAIQYNMVQCTMFNGVQHPRIVLLKDNGAHTLIREFTYEDFKARMG